MFLKIRRNRGSGTQATEQADEAMIADYLQTGNKEIIGVLFERYTHLVYGICLKYLGDHELSRDAVMEIFENLFDKLTVHKVVNFKNWLHSVARNHCLMILRQHATRKRALEKNGTEPGWDNQAEYPPAACEGYIAYLNAAVENLSNDQALCLRMMYYQDKSYQDISADTGYSMNQVKSHIQNGKRNLKIYLLSRYGYPSS
jgi:RNA polymerase sigma-70 factor (ECF subfamily)